jgi:cytochrome c peroxidase
MIRNKKIWVIAVLTVVVCIAARQPFKLHPVQLNYPSSWPTPVYDQKTNPLTKEGVELGRKLFYDPILSNNNTISCSSCHLSFTAFTHVDHSLSHGINDSVGTRNSPVLINLAWNKSFMWDGAIHHLDVQALAPITHQAEMGSTIQSVVHKLQQTTHYPNLFYEVYGDTAITGERLLKALAQFQLTLISSNSKYDQVMRKENGIGFTEQEEKGYRLFKQHCNSCHTEPLFTSGEFANNGLPVDPTLMDLGRMKVTQQSKDSLLFKIPTLRNIEFSYPYMHDGRFKSLFQVLNHYSAGIHSTPTLSLELKNKLPFSENDKVDLMAFLLTLTDKTFLFNPDFGFPRK